MVPKKYSTAVLLLVVIMLLCGCREFLPVNTDKYTPDEIEALRIVQILRAVVAEVNASEMKNNVLSVALLCSRL